MNAKQYGYNIKMNQTCDSSYRSDEQFGDWNESYTNSFRSIEFCEDKYPILLSNVKTKPNQPVFLVWFEYSSGDSFGHSENGNIEIAGLFDSYSCAKELQTAIQNFKPDVDVQDWKNKYKFICNTSDGQHFEYGFAPWVGYFESLGDVRIETVVVT